MDAVNSVQNVVKLKRVIGLFDGINIIAGIIIGSGIFITPAGILYEVKSVYMSLFIWFLCGLISILGAFCFVELASLVPKAGSGYAYLYEAFAPLNKYGDIPAFLSCWMSSLVITPGSISVLALTSSNYLAMAIFGKCSIDDTIIKCMSAIIIILVTAINCYSVRVSSKINNIFSVGKVLALIIIIVIGIINLAKGYTTNLKFDISKSEKSPSSYTTAFYYGLFTYDGWFALNNLVEEMKNPKRNLPLAIIISLVTIICLYLMVNISYLTILTPFEMINSQAVALNWADKAIGRYSIIILIGVFISVFGSCLGVMLSNTRIVFAASREKQFPLIFAMIDLKRLTPTPSILFSGLISILMIIFSNIYQLLDFFNFLIWIFYGLDIIALIILKKRNKCNEVSSDYRIKLPIIFPIIMLLFCIFLTVLSLTSPNYGHLAALAFLFIGLVYYFPFVKYKKSFLITEKLTQFFQMLLEVAIENSDESVYKQN